MPYVTALYLTFTIQSPFTINSSEASNETVHNPEQYGAGQPWILEYRSGVYGCLFAAIFLWTIPQIAAVSAWSTDDLHNRTTRATFDLSNDIVSNEKLQKQLRRTSERNKHPNFWVLKRNPGPLFRFDAITVSPSKKCSFQNGADRIQPYLQHKYAYWHASTFSGAIRHAHLLYLANSHLLTNLELSFFYSIKKILLI